MLAIMGKHVFPWRGNYLNLKWWYQRRLHGVSAYCHLSQEKKGMGGRGKSEQKEHQMQRLEGGKLPGAYWKSESDSHDWRVKCMQCGRPGFDPWVGKIPWRRERLPTPGFWPGEFHGLYSPWDPKELDMTERLSLSLLLGRSHLESHSVLIDVFNFDVSIFFSLTSGFGILID